MSSPASLQLVALNDQFEINCFMIGAIKEDKAVAISEWHLFAIALDSQATFPIKQANLCPHLHSFSCIKQTVLINCFMIVAIKEDKADAISELHLFAKAFPLKQANICLPLPLHLH
jgi:hypothetical protein